MAYPSNDIVKLSGSTNGQPIPIASTGPSGTTGTTIHVGAKNCRIELWAWNNSSSPVRLTLQKGSSSAAKEMSIDIPPKGAQPSLVLPFLFLEVGQTLSAFAGTANVICVDGPVNERTPAA